tara:strand:+ start:270 stop:509 length:240 start_codon:yes stop_codon:yes gene_type:complete
MNKTEIIEVSIFDYGSGGIYFYKIEVEKNADVEVAVYNLMELQNHKQSNCYWSTMCMNDIVNKTHTIITHQELKAMEDK